MLGSFKLKLVGAFLALAIVPLAAAFWGFTAIAERSVATGVDSRLEAGLSAAAAAFADERRAAALAAERLARDARFQKAFAERDRAAVRALLPGTPPLRVEGGDDFRVGSLPASAAAESTVSLVGPGGAGTIVAAVPLTAALADRLHARSGLAGRDELVLLGAERRVLASSDPLLGGRAELDPGAIGETEIGGRSYRSLGTSLDAEGETLLAVLTPSGAIEAERDDVLRSLVIGLLGSLLLIGVLAWLAGRSIVLTLRRLAEAANSIAAGRLHERVPARGRDELAALGRAFNEMAEQLEARLAELDAERQRLREANARFGEALASALDPEELRRVIVESAVEATQADGGAVIAEDGSVIVAGDVDEGGARLDFELTAGRRSYGRLVLHGDDFDVEERMAAASLAGQAVVALENARLHRRVEEEARVDALTDLANRRHGEERLQEELARIERFGDPVALVLADVDDFKGVNDRYGHPAGDLVLQDLADTLRAEVRTVDVPARWGGEEFAIVLPGTDVEGAVQLAERVREALARRVITTADGEQVRVTASFGAAVATAAVSAAALVEAADDALYRAKRAGKNRVVVARPLPPGT